MKNSPEYIAHVLELMRPTAIATTRAMFGGHGVYLDGIIVGIVVDDVLYLKTDEENRASFVELGLEPFRYVTKEGEVHVMSYHRAPDDALDGPHVMAPWLKSAHAAALRRKGASRTTPKRRSAKALR
ncbi:MAG TPA: TfoX/Sxy family protein [Casimicrobiaceae bacterium]|nr:TfoX/Sxy family protein [Casimicrobiaceae bacterium]